MKSPEKLASFQRQALESRTFLFITCISNKCYLLWSNVHRHPTQLLMTVKHVYLNIYRPLRIMTPEVIDNLFTDPLFCVQYSCCWESERKSRGSTTTDLIIMQWMSRVRKTHLSWWQWTKRNTLLSLVMYNWCKRNNRILLFSCFSFCWIVSHVVWCTRWWWGGHDFLVVVTYFFRCHEIHEKVFVVTNGCNISYSWRECCSPWHDKHFIIMYHLRFCPRSRIR